MMFLALADRVVCPIQILFIYLSIFCDWVLNNKQVMQKKTTRTKKHFGFHQFGCAACRDLALTDKIK